MNDGMDSVTFTVQQTIIREVTITLRVRLNPDGSVPEECKEEAIEEAKYARRWNETVKSSEVIKTEQKRI